MKHLLHVQKIPNFELYMSVSNNFIYILNKQSELQAQYPVDFNLAFQTMYSNYCQVKPVVNYAQYFQTHICKGVVYLQYFENVVKLENRQLVFVAQIPFLRKDNENSYFGRLFSLNNDLYVHNNNGQLFKLVEGKFISAMNLKVRYFFQFCDRVVAIQDNSVYRVQSDLSLTLIHTFPSIEYVSYAQSGMLIIQTVLNGNGFNFLNEFVNLVDMSIREVRQEEHGPNSNISEVWYDKIYGRKNIDSIQVLGETGLQLRTKFLNEIFDEEFQNQMVSVYQKYINEQIQQFPQFKIQMQNLLSIDILIKQYIKQFNLKYNKNDKQLEQLTARTHGKLNSIKTLVTKQLLQLDLYSTHFVGFNVVENDQ
ncbi:Conserved_hypothetical protein [Hexamita inflata]|uniref:Uncharacterized protein n=1 Tax=Hexamita inflata TaxID=28002 RepID=A0AA86RF17_9EUKA|nr:Conserved hypothetical protein [Hexamita inflata]